MKRPHHGFSISFLIGFVVVFGALYYWHHYWEADIEDMGIELDQQLTTK